MSHTAVQAQPQSMLERMMLVRAYEEKLIEFQQAGSAAGTCTSVGQEAAAVGVVLAVLVALFATLWLLGVDLFGLSVGGFILLLVLVIGLSAAATRLALE